jgi:hypothetical protein
LPKKREKIANKEKEAEEKRTVERALQLLEGQQIVEVAKQRLEEEIRKKEEKGNFDRLPR